VPRKRGVASSGSRPWPGHDRSSTRMLTKHFHVFACPARGAFVNTRRRANSDAENCQRSALLTCSGAVRIQTAGTALLDKRHGLTSGQRTGWLEVEHGAAWSYWFVVGPPTCADERRGSDNHANLERAGHIPGIWGIIVGGSRLQRAE
jgi:hypothetical protein